MNKIYIDLDWDNYIFINGVPLSALKDEFLTKYKCLKCILADKVCKRFCAREMEGCDDYKERKNLDKFVKNKEIEIGEIDIINDPPDKINAYLNQELKKEDKK